MYPMPPTPEYHPRQPKRRRFLWLSLIGCLSILAISIGAICALGTPAFLHGWNNGIATQTASHQATPSHTYPRMGGTLDDFVAQYGLPTATAPDNEVFTTSDEVQITAYVNNAKMVNRIFVTDPSSWTIQANYDYCTQFLPTDAQPVSNVVGNRQWVDYHSSLGTITMQLQTTTCLLFIAPS